MAKFPTYEEIAKKVAEKALNEFLYNGKSIREWMQIITSEDAVSRQAVIDALNKTSGIRGDALKALYELPPVTQPKIGRWIGHREHCENLGVMPSGLGAYNWCSNCDCGIDVKEWYRNNYNYCPNCGAKMQEAEE